MGNKLLVIGVGPGGEGGLTFEAREAMAKSECVYAAERHRALVSPERFCPLEPLGSAMAAIRADAENGRRVAVLVSGDTGLYSMLPMLQRGFGQENLRVIPGVSALQALCARLGETWQNARIVSVHGRTLSESALAEEARTHESTILFCDAEHSPAWIAEILVRVGLADAEIAVGEKLDDPDERVIRGTAAEIAGMCFDPLCMARVYNPRPEPAERAIGLADDLFIRGKTPMTKREIRALVVAALRLRRDSVVWDIGAGTGSVSVECARQCPYGRVLAVERDADALSLAKQNAEKFRLLNLEIVSGSAPEALAGLPAPTHVFLGGTGGDMPAILRAVERAGKSIRLAATAVTLESAQGLLAETKDWKNAEIAQIGVTRLEKAGAYRLFRAQNPVFILSADWEGEGT